MTIENEQRKNFISAATGLAAQLREQIRGGEYALGAALPTERDLCLQHKVSRWTVRHALQALEREHLVIRQHGRGTFVVNAGGSGPPIKIGTGLIGLMVWEIEYAFGGLVQGTCNRAASSGYAVTTGSIHELDDEAKAVRAFVHNNTLGVLLAPRSTIAANYYKELVSQEIAVVLVDTIIPGYQEDHVLINNSLGTSLATQHLIDLGHRRIAYLGHNTDYDIPIRGDRRQGYINACTENDLAITDGYIVESEYFEPHYHEPIRRLLQHPQRPTAVVVYNDLWAIRLMNAARELSIRVPQDLSVVGFDDSVMAPISTPPLTSINPERYEMGVIATELLIDKIERKSPRPTRKVEVTPRLVVRKTTASPPQIRK